MVHTLNPNALEAEANRPQSLRTEEPCLKSPKKGRQLVLPLVVAVITLSLTGFKQVTLGFFLKFWARS